MSKFKDLINKVASKFSTPVKPLAAEVFEEETKSDVKSNLKEKFNIEIDDSIFKESIDKLQGAIHKFTLNLDRIKTTYYETEQKQKLVRLQKIQSKTKSKRIKKKLQKRIDTYGK